MEESSVQYLYKRHQAEVTDLLRHASRDKGFARALRQVARNCLVSRSAAMVSWSCHWDCRILDHAAYHVASGALHWADDYRDRRWGWSLLSVQHAGRLDNKTCWPECLCAAWLISDPKLCSLQSKRDIGKCHMVIYSWLVQLYFSCSSALKNLECL